MRGGKVMEMIGIVIKRKLMKFHASIGQLVLVVQMVGE